jgi:hypothetical protein
MRTGWSGGNMMEKEALCKRGKRGYMNRKQDEKGHSHRVVGRRKNYGALGA